MQTVENNLEHAISNITGKSQPDASFTIFDRFTWGEVSVQAIKDELRAVGRLHGVGSYRDGSVLLHAINSANFLGTTLAFYDNPADELQKGLSEWRSDASFRLIGFIRDGQNSQGQPDFAVEILAEEASPARQFMDFVSGHYQAVRNRTPLPTL
jgi:hypothetical protein